jgi:hypothetical protein
MIPGSMPQVHQDPQTFWQQVWGKVTDFVGNAMDEIGKMSPTEGVAVGAVGIVKGAIEAEDVAKVVIVGEKTANVTQEARALAAPVFATTKEATVVADSLGFRRIAERVNGQAIYKKGKVFISRDIDGHNGGAWKMAQSVEDLASKETRLGTFNEDLTVRIGD